jgi:hypothetical protein
MTKKQKNKNFLSSSIDRAEEMIKIEKFAEELMVSFKEDPQSNFYREFSVRSDGSIVLHRYPPLPPKDQTTEKVSAAIKQWLSEDDERNKGGGWV